MSKVLSAVRGPASQTSGGMANQHKMVIVGTSKPILNYVTACITIFNRGEREVMLRARGDAINVMVEVVQLLRHRFLREVNISNIAIDGETVTARDGRQLNLPVLEILLQKGLR